MSDTPNPLPSFENPPVVEVVLGTQFDAIKGLKIPQIGLLWQEFRDRLPVTEEQPPLEPVIERFGATRTPGPSVSFQLLDAPPIPRCWFKNEAGTELIQVQSDRFIRNWRKVADDDAYPRYEPLRRTYAEDFERFSEFVRRENLGELVPNQCEVTYVNHVLSGGEWRDHGELEKVLSVLSWHYSDKFLGRPEEARATLKYIIHADAEEPIGRLHVAVEPVFRAKDDATMFRIVLTARAQPQGKGIKGVLRCLDIGRDWVVRGFASITTEAMHREWRRNDGC